MIFEHTLRTHRLEAIFAEILNYFVLVSHTHCTHLSDWVERDGHVLMRRRSEEVSIEI